MTEAGLSGTTQPEFILPRSAEHPDEIAVRAPEGSLTWATLEERMRRFAQGLRAEGVGPGAAWGLLANNRLEWAELTMGNARSGASYVPLNWHLTAAEVAELLIDSESRLLVVDPENESVGRAAAESAGVQRIIVLGQQYEAWLAAQTDRPLPECPLGNPLQYTGGTTGRSKGVVRSDQHGKASDFAALVGGWGTLSGMDSNGRAMLATPAYHALGGIMVRGTMTRGHTLDILPKWDPEELLRTIQDRQITTTAMVPTQFIRLLKLDPEIRSRFDVSSLRWLLHTAAPCPAWAKREMIEWFGPVITELYGSSEGTGPVICTSEEWLARPGTVGKASPALTLSVVGEDGQDLAPGEIGTIYVKRRDGVPQYHGDPAKSEAMRLPDGRFTVGDVGWLDEDGFLFLADRRVDLILSGGTNIYPAEIEAALSQHPSVADVAVFGIPHPDWGEEIKAVVELVDERTASQDEILEFGSQRLASFKLPRSVDFVDALPREASGKLKKRYLRDPYWS